MVRGRWYRDLLVAGGGDVDGCWGVEGVVVGGGRAVVLAAVDGQQVTVAVRGRRLDVLNTPVETVLQAVVRLQRHNIVVMTCG